MRTVVFLAACVACFAQADRPAPRTDQNSQIAHEQLLAIPGLTIHGPELAHKGAICSFTMSQAHPEDLANLLDLKGVFVRHGHHCTMPLHDLLKISSSARASFAFYNTKAEIDTLVGAVQSARKVFRLG